jgi:hypothetical protein
MQQAITRSPNVVWLADVRGWSRSEDDPSPPSPEPLSARRPIPPHIADAISHPGTRSCALAA